MFSFRKKVIFVLKIFIRKLAMTMILGTIRLEIMALLACKSALEWDVVNALSLSFKRKD